MKPIISGLRFCSKLLDAGPHSRGVLRVFASADMCRVQKAIVKSLPDEPNLTITLYLAGKQRNLDRPKNEALEKPLMRIQKSVAPQPDKRQKKKGAAAATRAVPAVPASDLLLQPAGPAPSVLHPPAAAAAAAEGGAAGAAAAGQPGPAVVALHEGPTSDSPLLDAAAVSNAEAWQHGRLLRVGTECFTVEVNPPLLDKVEVPPGAFVGIPLYPLLSAHFTEEDVCQWQWCRRRGGRVGVPAGEQEGWELIPGATSRLYTPVGEDAGCLLRAECTPARRRSPTSPPLSPTSHEAATAAAASLGLPPSASLVLGQPSSAVCGPVRLPPSPLGAAPRLALMQQRAAAPEFRVVTYNILADQYASTQTARTVLFKHCPPECLVPEYRRPLVLAELLGFNADVLCLQEVDDKMFTQLLQPQLGVAGYEGVYTNKAGKVREGSALFFARDRFRMVAQRDLTLKDFFPAAPGAPSPYAHVFGPMLQTSPQLLHALQRIATVGQLALLAPVNDPEGSCRPLLVANTHLFYHFMAPHIRTMHTWVLMQEGHKFMQEALADPHLAEQLDGQQPSMLFCGDLNSDLNDGIPGAVELLNRGHLSADFWDWAFGVGFKWGTGDAGEEGEEEGAVSDGATGAGEYGEVTKMVHGSVEHQYPAPGSNPEEGIIPGVDLTIPFSLAPADELRSVFTNYVRGYQGLLDYIWYSPQDVSVVRGLPLPTPKDLGGYLPSPRFPSDHLPVVFDLRFRQPGVEQQQQQRQHGEGGLAAAAGGAAGASSSSSSSSGAAGGAAAGGAAAGGDGGESGGANGSNVMEAAYYNVGVAVEALQAGDIVALPTDTLYGLAACANSHQGVSAIYETKRRQAHKPLAICVADPSDVHRYGDTQSLPQGLIDDLLPGPVTLLLVRRPDAPLAEELNPGVGAIGVRVPDSGFIRAICRQHRGALALTSANVSQALSSVQVSEFTELWPLCAAVFDGGKLEAGRAGSTIIDLTRPGEFEIVRRGAGFSETVKLLTEKYGLRHVINI